MSPPEKFPLMKWSIDTPIHEAIREAIGAASLCWQYPKAAGMYNPEMASSIADELEELLKSKLWLDDDGSIDWQTIASNLAISMLGDHHTLRQDKALDEYYSAANKDKTNE